jgi:hypothetical protein
MRLGKIEAVLPPLRTLAAYTTQKYFISLDGCGRPIGRKKFLPLSEEKGWKSLCLKKGEKGLPPLSFFLYISQTTNARRLRFLTIDSAKNSAQNPSIN